MRTVVTIALVALVVATVDCNFGSSSSTTDSSTAASSTAASATPSSSVDEGAALMQVSRDWAKATESRDVERIVSYWADDAVVLLPDRAAIVGKDALRTMVRRDLSEPRFTLTWEPERAVIAQAGDMGYLIEHNRVTFPDASGRPRTAYGKVVSVWKKDASGNWKCVVDISNNNQTQSVLPAE